MATTLLPWSAIILLILTAPPDSDDESMRTAQAKLRVLEEIEEESQRHVKLFSSLTETRLQVLKRDDSLGISLAAAWRELCLRGGKKPSQPSVIDRRPVERDGANYFIGFVEGRINSELPGWWKQAILSASIDKGQYSSFKRPAELEYRPTTLGLQSSRNTLITRGDESTEFEVEGIKFSVGNGMLDQLIAQMGGKEAGEYITFHNGRDQTYVAIYTSAGFQYRLACFTTQTNLHKWTADVWAAGRLMVLGHPFHWVEIREDRDRVFVYGVDPMGAYLESFDTKTGKNRIRFASNSWLDSNK